MSERGIQETKEVLRFVLSFVMALKKTYADGDFDWSDSRHFIDPLKNLGDAMNNIDEVLPEISNIDDKEYEELIEWMADEFPEIMDEHLEYVLDHALDSGKMILSLVDTIND